MLRPAALLFATALLAACQPGGAAPEVNRADRAADRVAVPLAMVPADACWTTDRVPAVTETRFVAGTDGAQESRQVVIRPTEERLFAVPCPEELDSDFAASLQRALSVRGFYAGPVTGDIDSATAEAVRRFQAPLGLNSAVLSLDAAQRLGLVAIPRALLETN